MLFNEERLKGTPKSVQKLAQREAELSEAVSVIASQTSTQDADPDLTCLPTRTPLRSARAFPLLLKPIAEGAAMLSNHMTSAFLRHHIHLWEARAH